MKKLIELDDLISRQAAIDAVKKNTFRLTFAEEQSCEGHVAWSAEAVYSDVMEGALLELPSAQPERKMGKWIYNSPVTMKCDQCGFVIKDWDWHRFKFCPNCDCDMRGEQE